LICFNAGFFLPSLSNIHAKNQNSAAKSQISFRRKDHQDDQIIERAGKLTPLKIFILKCGGHIRINSRSTDRV
jgi:hypothetical protein